MVDRRIRACQMSMGSRIIQLRRRYKFSQSRLGELCGVTKAAVSQWETGASTPELKKLLMIRSRLDFSLDWLMTGEGEMMNGVYPRATGGAVERRLKDRRSMQQHDRRRTDRRRDESTRQ
ncbi:helix-turn-helix domain-containing protein [Nitrosovibrio sp. Nv17]|jgi:transcriptional regulator with XRE-family HTH domain|uniref:helix-turn-helix domain-containing protein n=1 Tax=Nitrosovibrio sp. Nv17 TaxID=1855339 RepID=UPI000908B47D|nr:helix-turn-helix transcriptional regulator [Nitrosovibrio sp. Nv17]SFW27092.1 DNA-binding transcriptional regulator, XRE-family HTH domain [Nitrosovibrio sp. Nv17]